MSTYRQPVAFVAGALSCYLAKYIQQTGLFLSSHDRKTCPGAHQNYYFFRTGVLIMEYITLGKSRLHVSRICLGCMGFGNASQGMHAWTLPEEESRNIIRHALSLGINFFDTAMGYQNGTSEQFLGRAVRDFARREDVVIATKFVPRSVNEREAGISGQQHVADLLDASLKRLGMDYVDLYICHMWDYHTPIEETLEGLYLAIRQGKIRYAGISNCYAFQIAKANAIAKANGWEPFISVQGHYNLIFREEEREMVPYCKEEQIAMTPYSALASGRLARRPGETSLRMEKDAYARGKYDATQEADQLIIRRVADLAERRGVSMTEISLAWLMEKTAAPVAGATKTQQLCDAAAAVNIKLTPEEIRYLEELYQPHALTGIMAENRP